MEVLQNSSIWPLKICSLNIGLEIYNNTQINPYWVENAALDMIFKSEFEK